MLRTVTLSLLLLISVGVMLPFASSTAHGLRQSAGMNQHRRHRHHSRVWWRHHRALLKRRHEAALAHRNAPLSTLVTNFATGKESASIMPPKLPAGWDSLTIAGNREMRFKTDTGNAAVTGQAALAVIALSRPAPAYLPSREQQRILGGVSFSDLRRTVIDKMVAAGGWVINDYQRDVEGKRVFVVTAQTPADGHSPEKSWNFYFTEINGRIYSLTTNTPLPSSERMSGEAERFIASLQASTN